ncbi:MAG: hypothetical protein C5B55_00770 [Blastocatellia bacterium]|nr:MAG: hypothetical protein C5B55_00770 [Blastocatellia bacterium]
MLRTRNTLYLLFSVVLALVIAGSAVPQNKDKKEKKEYPGTPTIWSEPTDLESRNLLLGNGGEQMKPDLTHVTFIEEKKTGWSKKYRVRDGSGNEWMAKLSKEAQPETAANRLVWAVGYPTEISYLVPSLTIEGKGTFQNVRMEARPKTIKRTGLWQWESNPFIGKREFQGLKIMMLMINNWDMKDDNNQILATKGGTSEDALLYIVSDLGGSFGKTGGALSRSRNNPDDYVKAKFIQKVSGNTIDFNYGGKNKKLFENISVADARWLSQYLGRLSDEQIKDAFRAANYSAEDVNRLAAAFKERIRALAGVAG